MSRSGVSSLNKICNISVDCRICKEAGFYFSYSCSHQTQGTRWVVLRSFQYRTRTELLRVCMFLPLFPTLLTIELEIDFNCQWIKLWVTAIVYQNVNNFQTVCRCSLDHWLAWRPYCPFQALTACPTPGYQGSWLTLCILIWNFYLMRCYLLSKSIDSIHLLKKLQSLMTLRQQIVFNFSSIKSNLSGL